jgi:uncharacterized protein (TIGR02231 family)
MTPARTAAGKAPGMIVVGCVAMTLAGCARPHPAASPPHRSVTSDVSTPAVADEPEASSASAVASRVTKVTVFSDRARVTRKATVQVSTEPTVFAFRKLPGWVDDGSVRVSASEGRIVDVRVERNFLARATDATWQKAKARDQALKEKLEALDDEISVLDAQKAQIEGIKAFSLDKINRDAILGNIKVTSYAEVLAFISNALRATARERRVVLRQRERINPEYQASQRKLAELQSVMTLEETTVLVTLQSSRATPSTLELTYMLPGATWEPMHDLRVSTSDAQKAEVISFAVVTQTSGEDWQNVELTFSTQSSTESVRIPELEALTLGDTHTATRVETSKMSSFLRAQEAFQRQSSLWNKVHQKSSGQALTNFDRVYQSKMEYLQVVQNKTVQIFESLQKRGTTAHFRASAAPSVRGDGHPVRMLIGHSTLATRQKIVAVPEQSLNAARTLQMTNSSGQSLLPGKVALYQDGAFFGMTEIDFIAQNEPFSLFLSVADHLKLSRRLDRKQSSLVRKRRNKMRVVFIVTVENLSSQDSAVALVDRIPVSENKDIKIDDVKVTDAVKPDSRGLLHWTLSLKPAEKRYLRVAYQVEYPAELILETRRKQESAARPAKRSALRSPSSPNPSPAHEIGEQLMDLESLF